MLIAFGDQTGNAIINMPLSEAEFVRWDAASHAIDGMQGVSGSNPLGTIPRTNQSLTGFSAACKGRFFDA